jgi:hypothetical protein
MEEGLMSKQKEKDVEIHQQIATVIRTMGINNFVFTIENPKSGLIETMCDGDSALKVAGLVHFTTFHYNRETERKINGN